MSNVVGMDGRELPEVKLTPEQQEKRWQVEERARQETNRLKFLQIAKDMQNPSAYDHTAMISIARDFEAFVTKETKDGQGTQTVPAVAPDPV